MDDILASKTTKEEMESQLLGLIKRHCPPKICPLAGDSIHWFRDVIRLRMPSVYDYVSVHVIDDRSFSEVVRRWSTNEKRTEKERYIENIMHEKYPNGREEHRAMFSVETSIEIMKLTKTCLANF